LGATIIEADSAHIPMLSKPGLVFEKRHPCRF